MSCFFTSDTHFGHDRGFIYEPRSFTSIQEHDEGIIERWNKVVRPNDTVYHLGDAMLGADHDYGLNCIKQLNGDIKILLGNHDTDRRAKEYAALPHVEVLGYSTMVKAEGHKFYLCHYPTITSSLENTAPVNHHVIDVFGHTHQKDKFYRDNPLMACVCLDSWSCYPVDVEVLVGFIHFKAKECLSYL